MIMYYVFTTLYTIHVCYSYVCRCARLQLELLLADPLDVELYNELLHQALAPVHLPAQYPCFYPRSQLPMKFTTWGHAYIKTSACAA